MIAVAKSDDIIEKNGGTLNCAGTTLTPPAAVYPAASYRLSSR